LSAVYRLEVRDRLYLHNDFFFDQQVDSVPAIEGLAPIGERKSLLALDAEPTG